MGKRSDFARRKNDLYNTPREAVVPLLPFLLPGIKFYEPCEGRGHLIKHLEGFGYQCAGSSDKEKDFRTAKYRSKASCFITNPPWTRELLHPGIENLCTQKPTWLLLDADWMHTVQAAPYMKYCRMIISIGRIKWIKNSPHTGKDNACWYLFHHQGCGTYFVGRRKDIHR